MGLDRSPEDVANVKPIELEGPFCYPPGCISIVDDFAKGCRGHHRHGVLVEVVDQLPLEDEDHI